MEMKPAHIALAWLKAIQAHQVPAPDPRLTACRAGDIVAVAGWEKVGFKLLSLIQQKPLEIGNPASGKHYKRASNIKTD